MVPVGGPQYLRMELYTKYATVIVPNAGNDIARRHSNHLQSIASLRNTVSVCQQYILNFIQFPEKIQRKKMKIAALAIIRTHFDYSRMLMLLGSVIARDL